MHTFLSRGSGQASARQYVQATSGKGLRPTATALWGGAAGARKFSGQLDLSVGFGTLREVSYTVTALVVSVRSLRAPRPPTAADWTRGDELGVGPDAIAGKSLKCCKREVADASELSRGRERSRSVPLRARKSDRRAASRAARVKGETHGRRAATRLNLAGPSRMKRILPAVALGRDVGGSPIGWHGGRGPPRAGVHRCPRGAVTQYTTLRPQHGTARPGCPRHRTLRAV